MIQWLIKKYRLKLKQNPNYIRQKPMGRGAPTWDEWEYLQQFDWYYDEFTFEKRFSFKESDLIENQKNSSPCLTFKNDKLILKVFCHNNLDASRKVIGSFSVFQLFPIFSFVFAILYFSAWLSQSDINFIHHFLSLFFGLPIFISCSLLLKVVKESADIPYAIFDGHQNTMIIRSQAGDEHISYDRISFQLLSIYETALGGAIEMNISYEHEGLPPKQIITDIFETPQQAHSILKTYYTILSGDPTIYEQDLKPHPVTWREFNLPFWQAAKAYRASSMRRLMCVFPHYLCFRLIHGHPMAVLREYEMEKDL